ncbi:PspA/IM30 family protein [Acetobacterium fimetarium]|uniref:PspA/IM30 family protein n=1 Tax=Acetobacterium fimetarium TaxID=52691 RepID=A0ABR6WRF2_9FIRM|nr:PspA/IM30 family protein [Acetobacterium fimetarium]MBC3803211.1 PspA/IM30 family protein [Acetobacterium fimetarium]
MAIFERLGDLLKANVNDMLDKAEDPEKMVKQIIIDMEAQVNEATQGLGAAMGSEKQALKQLESAKASSEDWNKKAKLALQSGNEELAKKALAQKASVDQSIVQFQAAYDTMSMQTAQLKDQVRQLKAKLEEARMKQNMLIARSKMADAQKGISTSLNSTDSTSAFSKLDKMEQKVNAKEAEAQAFSEMAGESNSVTDEFAALETENAVDDELAKLKAEMGIS